MSINAAKAILKRIFFTILLLAVPMALGFMIGLLFKGQTVTIISPQEALSNLSGFISTIIGFLISFIVVTLGFSSSETMCTILESDATRFEYMISCFFPIVVGFMLEVAVIILSAMIDVGVPLVISARKLCFGIGIFCGFFALLLGCLRCIFKVTTIALTEKA